MGLLIFVVGLSLIVLILVSYSYYINKKRREFLDNLSKNTGGTFDPQAVYLINLNNNSETKDNSNLIKNNSNTIKNDLDIIDFQINNEYFYLENLGLEIFFYGHSKKAENLLIYDFYDQKLLFFDYRYTIGSGRSSQTYNQTLAMLKLNKTFPSFSLRNESFFDKLVSLIGFDDIDIENQEEFSKKYYLKGIDKEAVKGFFYPLRIEILNKYKDLKIYAGKNFIIFQKGSGNIALKEYQYYMEEIKSLIISLNLF